MCHGRHALPKLVHDCTVFAPFSIRTSESVWQSFLPASLLPFASLDGLIGDTLSLGLCSGALASQVEDNGLAEAAVQLGYGCVS